MDDADFAAEHESGFRQAALERQIGRARQQEAPRIEGGMRLCRDCGERIPWARLRVDARVVRCIECQNDVEKRN